MTIAVDLGRKATKPTNQIKKGPHIFHAEFYLSYDVTSGTEIIPCNKIDKPLVVYRFSGNVMTSIATMRT